MQATTFLQRIDMSQTSWFGALSDTFYLIENPAFIFQNHSPYCCSMAIGIYCRQGHAVGRINMTEYELCRDGFLILLPNQIIESVSVSPDFEGTYIVMSQQFLNSLNIAESFKVHNSVEHSPYIQLNNRTKEPIINFISMCKNAISVEENPHRMEIVRLLSKAFFLGFGYFMHQSSQPRTEPSHQAELMMKFIHLVEDNYRAHRDLEFYANKMNITAKYLSRAIKKHSEKNALQWIEHYVILYAKSQLASTNKSVKQISYELNFPSPSFFGKYFHRIVGLSPVEYRKSLTAIQ